MKKQTLRPLDDRVVILPDDEPTQTKSGIVLPAETISMREKAICGTVLAVGRGRQLYKGELATMSVKVGDRVLFGRFVGAEVELNGKQVKIIRESEIIAVREN